MDHTYNLKRLQRTQLLYVRLKAHLKEPLIISVEYRDKEDVNS